MSQQARGLPQAQLFRTRSTAACRSYCESLSRHAKAGCTLRFPGMPGPLSEPPGRGCPSGLFIAANGRFWHPYSPNRAARAVGMSGLRQSMTRWALRLLRKAIWLSASHAWYAAFGLPERTSLSSPSIAEGVAPITSLFAAACGFEGTHRSQRPSAPQVASSQSSNQSCETKSRTERCLPSPVWIPSMAIALTARSLGVLFAPSVMWCQSSPKYPDPCARPPAGARCR